MDVRINVFAGARRVALLLTVVAVIATITVLATTTPYVSINVRIENPLAPFVVTDAPCPKLSAKDYFTTKIDESHSVGVDLCLPPMDFKGQQLIPYKVDADRMVYGAESYSDEVQEYERALQARFQLSPADLKAVKRKIAERTKQAWKDGLLYLAIALAIFWFAVWAIGWVVRGFVGIPLGKDHREPTRDS